MRLRSPRGGVVALRHHSRRHVACVLVLGVLSAARGSAQTAASPPTNVTPAPGRHDATARHSFADVAHWATVFDDPARDAWQKPQEVVRALGIRPRMRVADLGAGTGYFSRHLAAAVGEAGTVFAVDTEPNLVAHLRTRAEKEGTANVVPVLASPENPRLPENAIDVILIVDTVHHIDDRLNYFRRLQRFLTPTGRVAIIDFKKEKLPVGPPMDHKLDRQQVVDELQQAGYQLVAEPDLLAYQYFLIFRPL